MQQTPELVISLPKLKTVVDAPPSPGPSAERPTFTLDELLGVFDAKLYCASPVSRGGACPSPNSIRRATAPGGAPFAQPCGPLTGSASCGGGSGSAGGGGGGPFGWAPGSFSALSLTDGGSCSPSPFARDAAAIAAAGGALGCLGGGGFGGSSSSSGLANAPGGGALLGADGASGCFEAAARALSPDPALRSFSPAAWPGAAGGLAGGAGCLSRGGGGDPWEWASSDGGRSAASSPAPPGGGGAGGGGAPGGARGGASWLSWAAAGGPNGGAAGGAGGALRAGGSSIDLGSLAAARRRAAASEPGLGLGLTPLRIGTHAAGDAPGGGGGGGGSAAGTPGGSSGGGAFCVAAGDDGDGMCVVEVAMAAAVEATTRPPRGGRGGKHRQKAKLNQSLQLLAGAADAGAAQAYVDACLAAYKKAHAGDPAALELLTRHLAYLIGGVVRFKLEGLIPWHELPVPAPSELADKSRTPTYKAWLCRLGVVTPDVFADGLADPGTPVPASPAGSAPCGAFA